MQERQRWVSMNGVLVGLTMDVDVVVSAGVLFLVHGSTSVTKD